MIKTRLAPSPTGDPHIGTVFQALLDYLVAKKFNGQFLVRIEDTDRKREVAGAEAAIFSALDWFGLSPDTNQIFRQSERLKIYQEQAQKLIEQGFFQYVELMPIPGEDISPFEKVRLPMTIILPLIALLKSVQLPSI